ncbi:MAG TPA: hypothetical protein VIM06_10640 [Rhodanobacter sp.]
MSIVLHIERLVIDEVVLQGERPAAVRMAIESELTRYLAQPGAIDALRGIGAVASLSPATLPVASHPQQRLGVRVASAVQQRLGILAAGTGGKE